MVQEIRQGAHDAPQKSVVAPCFPIRIVSLQEFAKDSGNEISGVDEVNVGANTLARCERLLEPGCHSFALNDDDFALQRVGYGGGEEVLKLLCQTLHPIAGHQFHALTTLKVDRIVGRISSASRNVREVSFPVSTRLW